MWECMLRWEDLSKKEVFLLGNEGEEEVRGGGPIGFDRSLEGIHSI